MEKEAEHVNPRQGGAAGHSLCRDFRAVQCSISLEIALVSHSMNPESYTTMAEVRAGVDEIDRQLVTLLAERFAHMRAAARIKPERKAVRDEARKAQVIDNARMEAERAGAPAAIIAELWDHLVEASIAYELKEFDRTKA